MTSTRVQQEIRKNVFVCLAGKVSLLFCCLQFFDRANFLLLAMPPCTRSRSVVQPARQANAAVWSLSALPTPGAEGASVQAALLEEEEENAVRIHLLEKALKEDTDKNMLVNLLSLDHCCRLCRHRCRPVSYRRSSRNQGVKNRKTQRKQKKKGVRPSSLSSSSSSSSSSLSSLLSSFSRKYRGIAYQHKHDIFLRKGWRRGWKE